LRIFSAVPEGLKRWYVGIIAVIVILYIMLVVFSLILLSPLTWYTPVNLTWDELQGAFHGRNERDLILVQISAYLNVIDLNRQNVKKRYHLTIIQGIIFAIIVVLVITAGLIPYL